jgi:imidazolonepropionase-like amidohydrolase
MNGQPAHLVLRRKVNRGEITGPKIYTAGPSIFNTFSLFGADKRFARVRSAAEAEKLVREQSRAGYDMIKVLNGIELPVYNRLLEAARAAQIPVVGHVVSQVGTARSLAAGQVSLEHDKTDLLSGARAIASAGAWVGTIISDRNGGCRPPSAETGRIIRALSKAGVPLLAGSDANIGPIPPGAGLHCELQTLVAAGLTPYEALVTATRNPGNFAAKHLEESVPAGTITVGARADMLVLSSDPRVDIRAAGRPGFVVLRGILLNPTNLVGNDKR